MPWLKTGPPREEDGVKHNWMAIVVAVVATQLLGFLWYGVFFQEPWAAGLGIDMAAVDQSDPTPFAIGIVGNLVGAIALSWLIHKTGMVGGGPGAALGLVIGFCFLAMSITTHYAFGQVGMSTAAVDASNAVVSAALMGLVIGAWPARSVES